MPVKSGITVFVAGHRGMVGSAIIRALKAEPNVRIVTRNRNELDLTDQAAVRKFFKTENLDQVYLAAAQVGGIYANNTFPADFIYRNLMIEANIIEASFQHGVKKLLFLGSSCIYPKNADYPIDEPGLLSGPLEPTNEPYAIAKIAGIKLCESFNRQYGESHGVDFRSVMPCNLYGPGDSYDPKNSHVIPGLIRRFHEAKIKDEGLVKVWGTGEPLREFLYVDDLADACVLLMNLDKEIYKKNTKPMCSHINVGYGSDISIAGLSKLVASTVGYSGKVEFDSNYPDGVYKKLIDSSRIKALGWAPKTNLESGLRLAYEDFKAQSH